jgi:hypothetical protein
MKISELVAGLEALMRAQGDVDVYYVKEDGEVVLW